MEIQWSWFAVSIRLMARPYPTPLLKGFLACLEEAWYLASAAQIVARYDMFGAGIANLLSGYSLSLGVIIFVPFALSISVSCGRYVKERN